MKKKLALILAVMIVISLSACSKKQQTEQNAGNEQAQTTQNDVGGDVSQNTAPNTSGNDVGQNTTLSADLSANTTEELEVAIANDVEKTVNNLNAEWKNLSTTITTYGDYLKNVENVTKFYERINDETELACIRLQEYAAKYAELIMSSTMSNDDKYDAMDDLFDCIYDGAADDLYEGIYEDLLDDMQDVIYEEALNNSDDAENYSDWAKARSDEYKNWADARSDVYKNWSDTRSDLYSFCSDMRGKLWGDDVEKAEKVLADYKEDVEKLKK